MNEIINIVKLAFSGHSDIEPYTSYDAIPVKDKESFFTVISVTKYETAEPIYSDLYIYFPILAEITLTVLAPQGSSANELFDYYNKHVEGVIDRISGMKKTLRNMKLAPDTVSKRLALTVVFQIDAMKNIKRPESW